MAANFIKQEPGDGIYITLDLYRFKEGEATIVYAPALDISGYGKDTREAHDSFELNLKEYLDYTLAKKTLVKDLRNHGWKVRSIKQHKFRAPSLDEMVSSNEILREILINRDYSKSRKEVQISA